MATGIFVDDLITDHILGILGVTTKLRVVMRGPMLRDRGLQ